MSFAYGFGLPHWQPLSGGFSPAGLFQAGVIGTFYDPSDRSTLFTTSTGTTPCAVPGSGSQVLVGLMLDKSQGAPGALGVELVTNGDFSQGSTGWTPGAGWSIAGGVAIGAAANTNLIQSNVAPSPAGKTYRVTLTIVTRTTGSIFPQIGGSVVTLSAAGTYTFYLTPTLNDPTFYIPGNNFTGTITNISIRQIPGNHAIAFNDTTARPELSARVNRLERTEEISNAYWTKTQLASFAASGVTPNGVTAFNLVPNTNVDSHRLSRSAINIAGPKTMRVVAKANGYNFLSITDLTTFSAGIDLITGTQWGGAGTAVITSLGNGWWEIKVSGTATASTSFAVEPLSSASFLAYAGDGVSGVLVGEFDDRFSNIGANVPAYQRIADQYTYDSNGFPSYLRFDGVDDSMYTPASIPFATVTSDGLARRNLLSNPTQFDNAPWSNTRSSTTANAAVAPDGTNTADKLIADTNNATHFTFQGLSLQAITYTFSVYAKAAEYSGLRLFWTEGINPNATFDLLSGTVISVGADVTASIVAVGNGWYRCSYTKTNAGAGFNPQINVGSNGTTFSFIGDGTSGIFIWGAQLETGSTATAFQNIGTDKVAVFAGVRKLSDAAVGMFAELSAAAAINNGSFYVAAPESTGASGNYTFLCGGTAGLTSISSGTLLAPNTSVLTGIGEISTDTKLLRINGAQVASSAGDQGTGNYGTYPLYIGARNNSSLRLNGHLYSLIIAGTQLQSGSITATEQYVAGKTGVQI